ncbi:hypothetical protein BHE74_00019570 [Ensete ventricosum]|nr:hypothetical protein BHE74_00019570 [Ensete ventricosum]
MIYNTHYKSSCNSTGQGDEKRTNPRTNLIFGGVTSRTYPTRPSCKSRRSTRIGVLPLHPDSTTPTTDLLSRALNPYASERAPTSYRGDHGRASAHGPEPASACSADSEAKRIYYANTRFPTNILALEGGPMSPERPFTDSGTER